MQNNSANEDVIEIDLQELFGLLLHWLWLIVLCGIAAGAVGFVLSRFVIVPQYESTTTVYILSKNDNNNSLTYSDTQLANQLTKDYEELITSRNVLEQVIDQFQLWEEYSYNGFKSKVTVSNPSDTRMISITVKDTDPAVAQQLADSIRDFSAERITSVMNIEAVNVVDTASLPTAPSEPSIIKWTVLGAAIGIFLSAVILIIRFLMDDTIKSSEDIEKYLSLSTLALIPDSQLEEKRNVKKGSQRKSSSSKHSHSEHSHAESEEEPQEYRETRIDQRTAEKRQAGKESTGKIVNGDMEIIEYSDDEE